MITKIDNETTVPKSKRFQGPYSQSTRNLAASVNIPEKLRFAKFCIYKSPANSASVNVAKCFRQISKYFTEALEYP